MTNYEKLFIHLFTRGIEHYRDSQGTVRAIDTILAKDDETLFKELQEAFNQANRIKLLKEYGVPLEIGADMPKDLPEDLLERVLKNVVSLNQLKVVIKNIIEKR